MCMVILNPSNAEATIVPKHKDPKIFENHLNPVILVFIGKLSLSTPRWVPTCQGFKSFSAFLHHFVLTKLALRVNQDFKNAFPKQQFQNFCPSRFSY